MSGESCQYSIMKLIAVWHESIRISSHDWLKLIKILRIWLNKFHSKRIFSRSVLSLWNISAESSKIPSICSRITFVGAIQSSSQSSMTRWVGVCFQWMSPSLSLIALLSTQNRDKCLTCGISFGGLLDLKKWFHTKLVLDLQMTCKSKCIGPYLVSFRGK